MKYVAANIDDPVQYCQPSVMTSKIVDEIGLQHIFRLAIVQDQWK